MPIHGRITAQARVQTGVLTYTIYPWDDEVPILREGKSLAQTAKALKASEDALREHLMRSRPGNDLAWEGSFLGKRYRIVVNSRD